MIKGERLINPLLNFKTRKILKIVIGPNFFWLSPSTSHEELRHKNIVYNHFTPTISRTILPFIRFIIHHLVPGIIEKKNTNTEKVMATFQATDPRLFTAGNRRGLFICRNWNERRRCVGSSPLQR